MSSIALILDKSENGQEDSFDYRFVYDKPIDHSRIKELEGNELIALALAHALATESVLTFILEAYLANVKSITKAMSLEKPQEDK